MGGPVDRNDPYFDQYEDAPPAETPQQEYDRFVRDYHAPDAKQVLARMKLKLFQNDYHAPDAPQVLAQLQAELDAAERGGQGGGGGNVDPEAFRAAWFASGGRTNADLINFVKAHPELGATVFGSKNSKVRFANGQEFQAVRSAGVNGGLGPAWDPQTGGGDGGGADFGAFAKGFGQTFKAPTAEEIRAMPGYQFARDEGLKAMDTGAAANGTLLTGGLMKDKADWATGLADQFGQQKYQNALGEYMNAYNIFRNDQNDIFGRFDRMADRGLQATGAATS